MSFNLIETAASLFTNETEKAASTQLGESEIGIKKALGAIFPVIFAGLAQKSSTHEGAEEVANMAQEQHHGGLLNNLHDLFRSDKNGNIMHQAGTYVSSLFGKRSETITNLISGYSGLKSSSTASLFSAATPFILSVLGRHMSENNVGAQGIASLLSGQEHHIQQAMPAELINKNIFGYTDPAASSKKLETITYQQQEIKHESASAMQWLLPTLLFILLGAGALYFLKGGCSKHQGMDVRDSSVPLITPGRDSTSSFNTSNTMGTGTVDSMGNYIYNPGNMITLNLPNNGGKLVVGENSTETKLVRFLLDQNAMVDTVKGNWFEFTNVQFKSGSSIITEESLNQLQDMVMITKAFPTAKFKIGGYTDNTGNEASNVSLSKNRAAAVADKLKELGANNGSILTSDGYGSQFPIGDNAILEGKAQNRRVSVNVKSK